eukprot:Amastigsp_a1693_577.p3 type:complete len:105 gc:universal Amastigsp_a1693_577:203-517(+)
MRSTRPDGRVSRSRPTKPFATTLLSLPPAGSRATCAALASANRTSTTWRRPSTTLLSPPSWTSCGPTSTGPTRKSSRSNTRSRSQSSRGSTGRRLGSCSSRSTA